MTQSNQWQPVILVLIEIVISYLLFVIGLCVFQLELGCPGGYFSGCWRIIRSDKSYFSPTDIDQWDAWKQTLRTIQAGSYLIVYHFLLFMLLWSYYKIITTKSYFKNPEIYDSLALEESQPNETEEKEEQEENIEEDDPRLLYGHVQQKPKLFFANEPTFCQSCKVHRPPRARHCSMCKRCVLKFDHHCPWVNNCVGFTNYKFFILFLFYGSLFSLYLFVTLSSKYAFVGWTGPNTIEILILIGIVLCFVNGFFVFFMFLAHLQFLLKNVTTYEENSFLSHSKAETDKYNLGRRKNIEQVFGNQYWLWPFPVSSCLGDGITFPLNTT